MEASDKEKSYRKGQTSLGSVKVIIIWKCLETLREILFLYMFEIAFKFGQLLNLEVYKTDFIKSRITWRPNVFDHSYCKSVY